MPNITISYTHTTGVTFSVDCSASDVSEAVRVLAYATSEDPKRIEELPCYVCRGTRIIFARPELQPGDSVYFGGRLPNQAVNPVTVWFNYHFADPPMSIIGVKARTFAALRKELQRLMPKAFLDPRGYRFEEAGPEGWIPGHSERMFTDGALVKAIRLDKVDLCLTNLSIDMVKDAPTVTGMVVGGKPVTVESVWTVGDVRRSLEEERRSRYRDGWDLCSYTCTVNSSYSVPDWVVLRQGDFLVFSERILGSPGISFEEYQAIEQAEESMHLDESLVQMGDTGSKPEWKLDPIEVAKARRFEHPLNELIKNLPCQEQWGEEFED